LIWNYYLFILIDGKYLIIIGDTTRSDNSQKFQLDPFTNSKSSDQKNHCLQFWYSGHGKGIGKVTIVHKNQNDDSFTFNWREQGRFIINNSFYFLSELSLYRYKLETNSTNNFKW